jgi:hypothetical protein
MLSTRQRRPGEGQTHPALVRARTAIALQFAILPVDIKILRPAQARPQIAIVARQAARSRGWCGRRRGRRSSRYRGLARRIAVAPHQR